MDTDSISCVLILLRRHGISAYDVASGAVVREDLTNRWMRRASASARSLINAQEEEILRRRIEAERG